MTKDSKLKLTWLVFGLFIVTGGLAFADAKHGIQISMDVCENNQGPDCTKLPVGDDYFTNDTPKVDYLFSCDPVNPSAPGSTKSKITWIDFKNKTWNFFEKYWLPKGEFSPAAGSYSESVIGNQRIIQSNNMPTGGNIGDWPMSNYSDLTAIDRNPGVPAPEDTKFSLPLNPSKAASPSCASLGAVGIMKNGVVIYHAADARGEDAVANEIVDEFGGHPAKSQYHYHFIPEHVDTEFLPNGHSGIVGFIIDGFPIYGYLGNGGIEMTNDDLDVCHGHEHDELGYHYHATMEYPYTIGCFTGTVSVASSQQGSNSGSSRKSPPSKRR